MLEVRVYDQSGCLPLPKSVVLYPAEKIGLWIVSIVHKKVPFKKYVTWHFCNLTVAFNKKKHNSH